MTKKAYIYLVLDIVHKGHLTWMENAKSAVGKDGISIVGILTKEAVLEEKKKKPILSFDERMSLARAIRYNDMVVPQYTYLPIENILNLKPDIVFESTSHSNEHIEKVKCAVESYGGEVLICPYYPFISSTILKKKIVDDGDSDSDT